MQEELWQAIVNCDAAFDGTFYYAVQTTGIVCRPSCKSRTPKPENVRIYKAFEDALADQFRPCKRCRPDQLQMPDQELTERAKQVMEERLSEVLTLHSLAEELHVSPYHLHHLFKRVTGTTPADYLLDIRLAKAKQRLAMTDQSVTEIAGGVGYANMGYFSTVFVKNVGVSPTEYRARMKQEGGCRVE